MQNRLKIKCNGFYFKVTPPTNRILITFVGVFSCYIYSIENKICNKYGFVQCKKCGKRFYQNKQNNLEYCSKCGKYQPIVSKVIKCVDCGKEVEVEGIVKNKKRCSACQKIYIRKIKTEKQKIYRENK